MFSEKVIFFLTKNWKLCSSRVFAATEMVLTILETLDTWFLEEKKIFSKWPLFHRLTAILKKSDFWRIFAKTPCNFPSKFFNFDFFLLFPWNYLQLAFQNIFWIFPTSNLSTSHGRSKKLSRRKIEKSRFFSGHQKKSFPRADFGLNVLHLIYLIEFWGGASKLFLLGPPYPPPW